MVTLTCVDLYKVIYLPVNYLIILKQEFFRQLKPWLLETFLLFEFHPIIFSNAVTYSYCCVLSVDSDIIWTNYNWFILNLINVKITLVICIKQKLSSSKLCNNIN